MHPLERTVRQWIRALPGLRPQGTIIVACSGGPDSTALLYLLHAAVEQHAVRLLPVYVDHGLRPTEAPDERRLVQRMARDLGLDWEVVTVDVETERRKMKKSLEHAARDLRYGALEKIRERVQAEYIAVGHTADDQVEEVLHRLLRGSSRKALAGMSAKGERVIRPLLNLSKQTLLEYLAARRIAYCVDSSNEDCSLLRNRIRHKLLPLLEHEYDPGIRKAILKTAANLEQDEELLATMVAAMKKRVVIADQHSPHSQDTPEIVLDRHALHRYHPALQRRLFESLLWSMGSPARYEHILAVVRAVKEGRTGMELHLSRGLRVVLRRDHLIFFYPRGRVAWRGSAVNVAGKKQ